MARKLAQSQQIDPNQESQPVDAIAADLAASSAEGTSNAPATAEAGITGYPPTPDPFGIDKDYQAGVERLRSHRYRQYWLRFDEKPAPEVIEKLKEHHYRWAPRDQAWVKPFKHDEAYSAGVESERLYAEVCKLIREAKGVGREL